MILEFKKLIENSASVSFEDLKVLRTDRPTRIRLGSNLLQEFFLALTDILETGSQEAHERERLKRRRKTAHYPPDPVTPVIPTSPPRTTPIIPSDVSVMTESNSLSTQNPDTPRYPTSFDTPQKKRDLSGSSMGQRSTETTPRKWTHSEAKVQALLNAFVKTLVNGLWYGNIDMPWVKGRYMYMTYNESSSYVMFH